jgi:hypothetical protein
MQEMTFFNRIRGGYLATLAAGLAIGFIAVGTASARSLPDATTVKHYTIAASAFAPDAILDPARDYTNSWDPSTLSNAAPGRCFNAGVALPDNAKLRSVTFYYTNGSQQRFQAELNRQNLAAHQSRVLVDFLSARPTGTATFTKSTVNITAANVVNTAKYAYSVGVCPFEDATFTGVTITYTS